MLSYANGNIILQLQQNDLHYSEPPLIQLGVLMVAEVSGVNSASGLIYRNYITFFFQFRILRCDLSDTWVQPSAL